ncbi:MAG: response regulator [Cyclobacteriaceae bacterium]|nr:response regulator [Cyclobacteriaceae bacterium]
MNPVYPVETAFIIDDSEVDLFVQKKFIEMRKFAGQVVTFSSPVQALEILRASKAGDVPELIFLDLNMPLLNGFEFLDRVREISTDVFGQMKVVILTSSNSSADHERAMSFNNVIRFISKPLTVQGLDDLKLVIEQG